MKTPAFLSVFLAALAIASAADKPHLLVYLSDDHSQYDSSLYGNPHIPTPEMEKLAADGIILTHAFVASPSCAPSRAALMTGLMPARNGAEANHTHPTEGTHILIQDLKGAGYSVAAFGKVAHGKNARRYGFDHVLATREHETLLSGVEQYIAEQPDNQPLCLFVGTSNPHVSWPMENSFDPDKVELPPHHLDTPDTRAHRAAYYQEIADLDRLLGDLRELAGEKLGRNVLFLHTSDHGSQWPFGKWNLYDYGTRVPFIAAWPGKIAPGSRSDAMVSWVDILPTLLDAAQGTIPEGIDGRSFLSVLRGETDSHRDRIFTTHSGDGIKNIFPIRAVRTKEWKLIHNLRPDLAHTNHSDLDRKPGAGAYWHEWAARSGDGEDSQRILDRYFMRPEFELYRISEDKWETENLIGDPSHTAVAEELKTELKAWMEEQNDTGEIFNEPRPIGRRETWHPESYTPAPESRPKKQKGKPGASRTGK